MGVAPDNQKLTLKSWYVKIAHLYIVLRFPTNIIWHYNSMYLLQSLSSFPTKKIYVNRIYCFDYNDLDTEGDKMYTSITF